MPRYADCFWSSSSDDPLEGVRTLYNHCIEGLGMLDEVDEFLMRKVEAERAYIDKLSLAKPKITNHQNLALSSVLDAIHDDSTAEIKRHEETLEAYATLAKNITEFCYESRKDMAEKQELLAMSCDKLFHLRSSANDTKRKYYEACEHITKFRTLHSSSSLEDLSQPEKTLRDKRQRLEIDYRNAVRYAEEMRVYFEGLCIGFCNMCQKIEAERLNYINALARTVQQALPNAANELNREIDVEREVNLVADSKKTGYYHLPPLLYTNYYTKDHDTIFGVPLTSQITTSSYYDGPRIPIFIKNSVKQLSDSTVSSTEKLKAWLEPIGNVEAIYISRLDIDLHKGSGRIVQRTPLLSLVGVLKFFLLELPDSLCTSDLYEPLKMLYLAESNSDWKSRVVVLKSILCQMNQVHYYSLATLSYHWHRLVADMDADNPELISFSHFLAPYVLRPVQDQRAKGKIFTNDGHEQLFMKDLLLYHEDVFTSDAAVFISNAITFDDARSAKSFRSDKALRNVVIDSLDDVVIDSASTMEGGLLLGHLPAVLTEDDQASIRALWDGQSTTNHAVSTSSVSSRKTGYTLTVKTGDPDFGALAESGQYTDTYDATSDHAPSLKTFSTIQYDKVQ